MFALFLPIIFSKRIPLGKDTLFFEPFDSLKFPKNWIRPKDKRYDGEFRVRRMMPPTSMANEQMLTFITRKKFYVLSSKIENFPNIDGEELVFQFESRLPKYIDCTGGYLKLFGDFEPIVINENTPALLTFGPEVCREKSVVLFKFMHMNKKTRKVTEIVLKDPPVFQSDGLNHLFTLILRPDNTYEILIDGKQAKKGSMYEDFDPPVNGFKEIPDPDDLKPKDWDEREYIVNESAVKPDDWDELAPRYILGPNEVPKGWLENEPLFVEDKNAKKPSLWSDEIFGEYVYPIVENPKCKEPGVTGCGKYTPGYINNPNYKGEWKKPMMKNPNYKGIWKQKMIPNKDYEKDPKAYLIPHPSAIGFNFWSADANIAFKNILISNSFKAVRNTTIEDFLKRKKAQINKDIERAENEMNMINEDHVHDTKGKQQKTNGQKSWFQKFVNKLAHKAFKKHENL